VRFSATICNVKSSYISFNFNRLCVQSVVSPSLRFHVKFGLKGRCSTNWATSSFNAAALKLSQGAVFRRCEGGPQEGRAEPRNARGRRDQKGPGSVLGSVQGRRGRQAVAGEGCGAFFSASNLDRWYDGKRASEGPVMSVHRRSHGAENAVILRVLDGKKVVAR